jgi:hypothetical protein
LENLEEMDKFLDTHTDQNWTEKIQTNRSIMSNEIEIVI